MIASEKTAPRRPERQGRLGLSGFPEGKTFLWLALGFVVCRYLTDTWLPALGLQTLAQRYTNFTDTVAPNYYFFVHYSEQPAWGSLALIGLGVAWGYLLYRARPGASFKPWSLVSELPRPALVATVVAYLVGIGLALVAKAALSPLPLHGRLGDDLRNATPVIATLLSLTVYLAGRRRQASRTLRQPHVAAPARQC